MTVPFGRLVTAMITPMTGDGELDLESAGELARALVASGTEAIVATGSTGEAPALSDHEKLQVWATVKEAVGHGVPVIAGATDNNTRKSIELAKEASRLGLDGLLLTVPAYSKPPQAGLVAHFTAIAEATRLPCMLYNIPGRSALNMLPETTLTLAQLPNVVGVKEASADLAQISSIIERAPAGFTVWSGNDSDTLAVLRAGGYGVVSVASHLVGRQIARLIAEELAGHPDRADAIDRELSPLVDALFCESNPIPLKFALNELGFRVGPPRLPLLPASEAAQRLIRTQLAKSAIDIKVPAKA
jgi:4-hydroxy-tetrahydrodipicolinate synthase